jgi:DNA-binding beta-propeller fold protein YncE
MVRKLSNSISSRRRISGLLFLVLSASATLILQSGTFRETQLRSAGKVGGEPRLISIQQLPLSEGEMCEWVPASFNPSAAVLLQAAASSQSTPAAATSTQAEVENRRPLRVIQDPYAGFSAVAVDPIRDEVVLTDENRFNVMVYDRLTNTPASATMSEPKRMIGGLNTKIQFQCGVYIDPGNGDIYLTNNDTVRNLVVFSRQAEGNVPPDREISTPYGAFGIAVDEAEQELFITVQHDGAVVVFPKMAEGEDPPVRLLQGERTGLADPHGIALDTKNNLIFVTNYGASRNERVGAGPAPDLDARKPNWPLGNWPSYRGDVVLGSGKFTPPSITVFSKNAQGDTAPLRVIQGPKTQLNWPTGIAVDPERGEVFVANATGQSITVYSATVNGDAAPLRVLRGPKTGLQDPTGIFLDTKNNELWVANFGNHSATVYRRDASGDTAPIRAVRSGPQNVATPLISNPHSIAYDVSREEILVPN